MDHKELHVAIDFIIIFLCVINWDRSVIIVTRLRDGRAGFDSQ